MILKKLNNDYSPFMEDGKEITIKVSTAKGEALLAVSDKWVEVKEETKPKKKRTEPEEGSEIE